MRKMYLLLFVTLLFVGCSQNKIENDLAVMNIKGSVVAVTDTIWNVEEMFGEVVKKGIDKLIKYEFNNQGNLIAVLEYGSPLRNIPSRPFMSNAIRRNHGAKLTRIAKKHLEHLFREEILNMGTYDDFGNYNPMTAARRSKRAVKAMLDEWASAMHDAIKHEVNNGAFAPLNPIYAKRRKKSKFLENSDDFVKQIGKWTTTER